MYGRIGLFYQGDIWGGLRPFIENRYVSLGANKQIEKWKTQLFPYSCLDVYKRQIPLLPQCLQKMRYEFLPLLIRVGFAK